MDDKLNKAYEAVEATVVVMEDRNYSLQFNRFSRWVEWPRPTGIHFEFIVFWILKSL